VTYRVTLAGVSDIGRVRKRNEDSLRLAPDLGIAVLADGMGGHPGGDTASRLAAATAAAVLERHVKTGNGATTDAANVAARLGGAMAESVMAAHEAVRAEADRRPELAGMGTTLTALVVDERTGAFAVGHVGDSRAYRLRGGQLNPLTRDDTWVQTQVDAERLTPEQARRHPFGHVLTQCVGLDEEPQAHVLTGTVEEGDAYLLCSDGLVGMMEDPDIESVLRARLPENGGTEAAVAALVEGAKEAGGYDNITVVVVRVE
jgi:serine/threonine protein phosphatase PrpC